jgi:hypothetical protein
MKTLRLAIVSLTAAFGALIASAQQAPAEAFVASVSGSVTVLKPGAAAPTAVVIGETLPEGSVITTGDDGSALIESHKGVQTGVGAKSSVAVGVHTVSADGVRTAVIDLKQGTTVSVLDPSKRSVNNYAVRTPKGVAAARGTTYSTKVTLSSGGVATVTVNTLTGAVSFSVGGETVSVTAGNSANSNSTTVTTIAQALAAANPQEQAEIAEALNATVAVVAIIAQAAPATGDTNAAATLASVTAVVNTTIEQVAATNPALAASMQTGLAAASNPPPVQVITNPTTGDVTNIVVPPPTATPTNPIIDITVTSPSSVN